MKNIELLENCFLHMLKFRGYIIFFHIYILKIQQSCTFLIKITNILLTLNASKILCVAINMSFRGDFLLL